MFAIAQSVIVSAQVKSGLGTPFGSLNSTDLDIYQKVRPKPRYKAFNLTWQTGYTSQLLYILATAQSQLSCLFFVQTLALEPPQRKVIRCTIASIWIWEMYVLPTDREWLLTSVRVFSLAIALQCRPPATWMILSDQCVNQVSRHRRSSSALSCS